MGGLTPAAADRPLARPAAELIRYLLAAPPLYSAGLRFPGSGSMLVVQMYN